MAASVPMMRLATRRGARNPRGLLRFGTDHNDHAADAADRPDAALARYDRLLAEEAELCAVPPDLLRAICWYASGWRQYEPSGRTISGQDEVGTRWGCMQLSDHWHPDAFPAAMSDPRANVRYAANLLNWLKEQTGSWNRATVAFFGHDAPAEASARRVRQYRLTRPWATRLPAEPVHEDSPLMPDSLALAEAEAAAGADAPALPQHDVADDLYSDLAL